MYKLWAPGRKMYMEQWNYAVRPVYENILIKYIPLKSFLKAPSSLSAVHVLGLVACLVFRICAF
jgi:hypothetical protein